MVCIIKDNNLAFQNAKHQFEATYYFLFGDDSSQVIQNTSSTVTHSYSCPGYFSVKVIVSTTAGNSSTTTRVFIEGGLSALL